MQRLVVDNIPISVDKITPGKEIIVEKWLPPPVYCDREILIRVEGMDGDTAVAATISLYDFDKSSPEKESESGELTSISVVERDANITGLRVSPTLANSVIVYV